jgi:purine catabolism regulator
VWAGLPEGFRQGRAEESIALQRGVALLVTVGKRNEGVLVFGRDGGTDDSDRVVARVVVAALGLLLATKRAVIEAERTVSGEIIADVLSGALGGHEAKRKLQLLGFEPAAPITVLVIETPASTDAARIEDLVAALDQTAAGLGIKARSTPIAGRIALVTDEGDLHGMAASLLDEMDRNDSGPGTRIAIGEQASTDDVRRSYLSAVAALAGSRRERVVVAGDLGSYTFLLGVQPRSDLEVYVRKVLGPLIDRDEERSSELVPSVRAYVEHGGRWEPAAEALGVHRHTLRYRLQQAEELLGRDLSIAEERMDIWLALKTIDLLSE